MHKNVKKMFLWLINSLNKALNIFTSTFPLDSLFIWDFVLIAKWGGKLSTIAFD